MQLRDLERVFGDPLLGPDPSRGTRELHRELCPFALPELPARYADDLLATLWRRIATAGRREG